MTASPPSGLIVMGVLKGAHGVHGEVRVKSYTAEPAALFGYGPLLAADGTAILTPASSRPGTDHFIVRPQETASKEDWDALKGTLLHVPRESLPAPEEDEYYITDLVGLAAYAGGPSPAGRVRAVHNFGGDDLLEIALDGAPAPVLIPFTREEVPLVDIASGRIVLADIDPWLGPGEPPESS
jgi:16S rRNA processing protein RimM